MNPKLRNRKLTGWRSMNDEERMRNCEERSRNWSWKRHESASAWIFSFFLLLLTNFKWILNTQGVEPFILSLSPLFIAKIREVIAAQLTQASWLLPDEAFWWAQCWRTPPSLISSPPFFVFCSFPFETLRNFTDYTAKSVKHLNSADKNLNGCKQTSPDEIRVWHISINVWIIIFNINTNCFPM